MLQISIHAALVLALSHPTLDSQDVPIHLRGEPITLAALGSTMPAAVGAVRDWLPFASECGYRFVLSDDGHGLLILSPTYARKDPKKEHRDVETMLALLRDATAVTDRFLRPIATDAPPLALVGSRTEHYAKLLAHVATLDPRLKEWTDSAGRTVAGYVLSDPLLGAWIEDPQGVDEWYANNELVHRTAQLMIRSRAGELPEWLLLGLAWHVEDTLTRSIYCFPYRNGFVSVGAHTDWGLWLANEFKKTRREKTGRSPLLEIDEFAKWHPGQSSAEFEEARAIISFGIARYLAELHSQRLPELATKFDAAIQKGRKVWVSATEWTTVPDFQIPADQQLAILRDGDANFLAKVTEFFQRKKANERHPPMSRR